MSTYALVLIPDGELRPTALGIVRSLGRTGVPVAVAGASRMTPSFCSRYVRRRLVCPSLERAPELWRDALVRFAGSCDEKPVLYPSADEHVVAIHRYRDAFARCVRYPFLEGDALGACLDKRRMYAICRSAGIETGTVVAVSPTGDPDDIARVAVFPSVLKPAMWADPDDLRPHRHRGFMQAFGRKAVTVRTREDLDRVLSRVARLSIPVLLQEHVPGPASAIVHVSVYADRASKVRGLFIARKTRQFPSEFGNACLLESLPCPEVARLTSTLVKTIGFHGIAGAIEFKRHARTGRLHFMEINARAAGSVSATAAAGVNLPFLAYRDALGAEVPDMTAGDREVRWIEGRSDLRYWLSYRKGDHTGRPFPLADYIRSLRGRREYAYWAIDDPLPWLTRAGGFPATVLREFSSRDLRRNETTRGR